MFTHQPLETRQTRRMTIAQYAARRNVSRQAIYLAIRTGRISREPDGSIDPVKADAQWQANTLPTMRWPVGDRDAELSEADIEALLRG